MADMIMIGDVGPGKSFKDGNDIYTSLSIDHNKTAMRGMIVKIKAKIFPKRLKILKRKARWTE